MKRFGIVFIAVFILSGLMPKVLLAYPNSTQIRRLKEMIERGNRYRRAREKAEEEYANAKDRELALGAKHKMSEEDDKLRANRDSIIHLVDSLYDTGVPQGADISYDPNCKARGYISEKCYIRICEPGFAGGPDRLASTKIHEWDHKKKKDRGIWGPGIELTPELRARLERQADNEQLRADNGRKTKLSDSLKKEIQDRKAEWQAILNALKALVPEWWERGDYIIPGRALLKEFTITNYSDFTQMVNCLVFDSLGWPILPNEFSFPLAPEKETLLHTVVFIPPETEIGTINEVFCHIYRPTEVGIDTASDFSFIFIIPTVDITPGPDTHGLRGQSIALNFLVMNKGNFPDSLRVVLSNPLGWDLVPPIFDIPLLGPLAETTLTTILTIPPDVPFWTTNCIFGKATSKTDTFQTDRDWLSVRVDEVDISPLMIASPLGTMPVGTVDTPKVYIYNSGDCESFFDVFLIIDLPIPHRDSMKGLRAKPEELIPIEMVPLTLTSVGTFNVKFYTRAEGDADPTNDTVRGTFQVVPYEGGWAKRPDVVGQPSGKRVKGGGGITAMGENVYLILGNNTRDFLSYDLTKNSWRTLCSLPAGERNKKVKKGAYIVDDETYVYAFKGGGTNEFYKYDPSSNSWSFLNEPGFTKGMRGGFASYVNYNGRYIYAGSGASNNEWKRFNLTSSVWEAALPALPVEKAKVGSGLTYDGVSKIYFLQGGGKRNYFWYCDLGAETPTWTPIESLPLVARTRKKKVKEGGCIEYFDGRVYAVKGGNTKEFWAYEPGKSRWTYIGEVGDGWPVPPAKGIKCGRSLTGGANGIFCLIGNNSSEFWFYTPPEIFGEPSAGGIAKEEIALIKRFTFKVTNPSKGVVKVYYTSPEKEIATLKVFNLLGEMVYSAKGDKGHFAVKELPAGVYLVRFSAKGYKEEEKLIVVK